MEVKRELIFLFIIAMIMQRGGGQSVENFYFSTCPNVESIVNTVVSTKFSQAFVSISETLRLFFHDCFVEGCDASVRIPSPNEKDAQENLSLVKSKQAVESECHGVVSVDPSLNPPDYSQQLMQACPGNVEPSSNMDPETPRRRIISLYSFKLSIIFVVVTKTYLLWKDCNVPIFVELVLLVFCKTLIGKIEKRSY